MSKPLIALTPSHDTDTDDLAMRSTYLKAVAAAGGIPVVLPLEPAEEDLECLADTFDGFLFSGGPDIHPFLFHEEAHPACGLVAPLRDRLELSLLPRVMARKKPVLGICRGIQLLNIALGGDIYQDIPSQFVSDTPIAHRQSFAFRLPAHTVNVIPDSMLAGICGLTRLQVNSMHHQAVRNTAPGLTACAFSPDGLIEALEKPDYPYFLGVQWHPEHLCSQDPAAAAIFSSFVHACRRES